jgi:predicted ATPase/tRNA A-37 threonylcarbamoyl transferase component Bud32
MPESIGPYLVLERLGRGGMGVVYRGRHHDSGELAAVKTVPVPDAARLQSLRREIHALARIRHPGVVRILDTGLQDGLPWYAMELVEGVTLWRYREELRPQEEPRISAEALRKLLAVLRRLCSALAYVHGEGVVHRDLKPENILITGRRRWAAGSREAQEAPSRSASCLLPPAFPVLVDFGLSARFGGETSREVLDLEGLGSGSTSYMAPEQMRGDFVDARADLYALGSILYALLTGRLPFRSVDEVQDPELVPVAPSRLAEGVPHELDALVLRLLAKEPRERPGHAGDVAAELAGLGAGNGGPEAGPRPRPHLVRPGLAGRREVLHALGKLLGEHAVAGRGGLILVGGESGIGKTRLALEVAQAARRRGLRVLVGECFGGAAEAGPGGSGAPLQALSRPLQQVADECRARGRAETQRLLGTRGPLISAYEPALAGLPGQEDSPQAAELPAEAARLRLFRALTETFAALAASPAADAGRQSRPAAPLLLILDDLQWADDLTAGWLAFLADSGRLAQVPLLILGTYRSEDVQTPACAALRALLEAPQAQRVELGRLEPEAVGELAGGMLGIRPAPAALVQFLARHTEGNPFFVAEVLRTAVSEGLLVRDCQGRWQTAAAGRPGAGPEFDALPLPATVRELVARRLQSLSPLAGPVAEAAAVLGAEMAEPLLAEVAGAAGTEALEAVRELLARQVLRESRPGFVRFDHAKIREVAYERIGLERRRALHRRAAEALERARVPDRAESIEVLAALGLHWERAEEPDQARRYFLEGARKAVSLYACAEAERLYDAYLALVQRLEPEVVQARNERAFNVLGARGRYQDALAEHGRALQEATALGDRIGQGSSLYGLAIASAFIGQFTAALDHGEKSLALHRELGDRRSEVADLELLGSMHQKLGRIGQAKALFEEGLERAHEAGDRSREGKLLGSLGIVHHEAGGIREARALYERALQVYREIADRRWEGVTLNGLAKVAEQEGRLGEARALFERSLRILREVGVRHSEGMTLANLAGLALRQGRRQEALELYEQALAILRESGDRWSEAVTLTNLAELRRQQGELDLSAALLEQALDLHRSTGSRRYEGISLSRLAHVRHGQGLVVEARGLHAQAAALLREAHHPKFEGIALGLSAALERRLGEHKRAASLLDAAEPLLRQGGDPVDLAVCLCERGHLALAAGGGRSASRAVRSLLGEVQTLAATQETGPESALAQAEAALRRALDAAEAGRALVHGELAEDLPEGLRRWLEHKAMSDER